jgi:hypothetical protein
MGQRTPSESAQGRETVKAAAWLTIAAAVLASLSVNPASGATSGPCTVYIAGVDLATAHEPITAPASGNLTYRIESASPAVHWRLFAHYGPFTIPMHDETFADGGASTKDGTASVADIARYGTGLYDITGDIDLADGSHCDVSFQLRISGPILQSVLGLVAVGLVGAGAVGFLALLVSIILNLNDLRGNVKDFIEQAREARHEAGLGKNPAGTNVRREGKPPPGTAP